MAESLARRPCSAWLWLLTACLLAGPASAQRTSEATWRSPEAFVEASGFDLQRAAPPGDLNGDGLPDWAGVVEMADTAGAWSRPQALYVLLQGQDKLFRVATQSVPTAESGMGCCWVESLSIQRGGLIVEHFAKTGYTQETVWQRFQLREGKWRLVGRTLHHHDESRSRVHRQDWNLLTGRREDIVQVEGRPTSIRVSKVKVTPAYLVDYDFSHGFGVQQLR